MTTASELVVSLPKLHRGQIDIYKHPARFKVLNAGRRFGKTELASDMLIEGYDSPIAVDGHYKGALDGGRMAYLSLSYKNIEEMFDRLKTRLAPIITRKNETLKTIEIIGGGSIECWSYENIDTSRGRDYHGIVADEAALTEDMQRIWRKVMRAMLADNRGWAFFISSSNGHNFFYDLWERGQSARSNWASWTKTIYDNPYISREEIAEIREELTDLEFAAEYLSDFQAQQGAVFRRPDNGAYVLLPYAQLPPETKTVAGIDWGQDNDYSVLSIIDAQTGAELYLNRWRQMDWPDIRGEMIEAMKAHNTLGAVIERNSMGSSQITELWVELEKAGLDDFVIQAFTTSGKTKHEIIQLLNKGLVEDNLSLLYIDYASAELRAYTTKRTASGMYTYSAPSGQHDDTVMARAFAWFAYNTMYV